MNPDLGYSIWLYGSSARGDSDEFSDVDLFCVGDFQRSSVVLGFNSPSISKYQLEEIEGMALYGSLYLQHIRLEGKELDQQGHVGEQVRTLINGLGPYKRIDSDLRAFGDALLDIEQALSRPNSALLFEASALAMVVRHTAILGSYALGHPTFGRESAIRELGRVLSLEEDSIAELVSLQPYRLAEDERPGTFPRVPTRQVLLRSLEIARKSLHLLNKKVANGTN